MSDSSSNYPLQRQAIEAALRSDWSQALQINQEIIESEPENVDCLNRLAKAYCELGKYNQAKKIYHNVLELDPYNTIAQKNLKKVSAFKKDAEGSENAKPALPVTISPSFFVEEPGLTKTVTLIKVAEPQKLFILSAGSLVNLVVKNRGITTTDPNNRYVGALPDDTAFHLMKLIKGGNKYQAFIKSIKSNSVTIMIREVFRSKKFRNQASFLDEAKVITYSSDHLSLLTDNNSDSPSDDRGEMEETAI